jgi:hypothetical protein
MATNRIETLDPALIRPGELCLTSSLMFIVLKDVSSYPLYIHDIVT